MNWETSNMFLSKQVLPPTESNYLSLAHSSEEHTFGWNSVLGSDYKPPILSAKVLNLLGYNMHK